MNNIPTKIKRRLSEDKFMTQCIHGNSECRDMFGRKAPRPEWEHAFIYAGKQIQEWWAIVPCCYYHHRGGGLDKRFNQFIALDRVSDEELEEIQTKYPRVGWIKLKNQLKKEYDK